MRRITLNSNILWIMLVITACAPMATPPEPTLAPSTVAPTSAPSSTPQPTETAAPTATVAPSPTATLLPVTLGPDFTLYRGDSQRTGAYEFPAIRELPTVVWQKSLNDITPAPLWAEGVLYISARGTQLCALNAETGDEIWCATTGDISSPAAVSGDVVIVNTLTGRTWAFHRTTGTRLWSVSIRGAGWGAPLIVDDVVYILSERGVYALEASTGNIIWQKNTGSHQGFVGNPAFDEGGLYFGVGPTFYALDSATGEEKWKVPHTTWFYGPVLANDLIYVGNDDGYFYALDQDSGAEVWKSEIAGTGWSAPSLANDRIYVGNIDQHIYAYDALTGNTVWKTELEDWATSDPVVSDGVVYVGSGNHDNREGPRHLYALDAETGAELWKFRADARLLFPLALSPDAIYIVSVVGTLYALK